MHCLCLCGSASYDVKPRSDKIFCVYYNWAEARRCSCCHHLDLWNTDIEFSSTKWLGFLRRPWTQHWRPGQNFSHPFIVISMCLPPRHHFYFTLAALEEMSCTKMSYYVGASQIDWLRAFIRVKGRVPSLCQCTQGSHGGPPFHSSFFSGWEAEWWH